MHIATKKKKYVIYGGSISLLGERDGIRTIMKSQETGVLVGNGMR